ncbi:MAG: hypothetical protein UHK44_10585 [Bacteroidaceae bacterium]|nr:hypothetical protein [Bacteroidaceae bacterium]
MGQQESSLVVRQEWMSYRKRRKTIARLPEKQLAPSTNPVLYY